MKLTKDVSFYKSALNIAIPIALQNLITFAVGMIDTMMLGSLGEIEWTKVIAFAPLFVSFSFPFPCVPAWLVCLSPSAACPAPSSSGTHPEACLAPVFGH